MGFLGNLRLISTDSGLWLKNYKSTTLESQVQAQMDLDGLILCSNGPILDQPLLRIGSMDPLGYAILAMSWIICTKPQVSLAVPIDGRLADCEALLVGSKAWLAVS